jgi:hypothetical protein
MLHKTYYMQVPKVRYIWEYTMRAISWVYEVLMRVII